MNKNSNSHNGKGGKKGQMESHENTKQEWQSAGWEANLNREKEIQGVESWNKKNRDGEKQIHPVEPSAEKFMNREKETQSTERTERVGNQNRDRESIRVESWAKKGTERENGIHPAEPSVEKNLHRATETNPMEQKRTNLNWEKDRFDPEKSKNTGRQKEIHPVESSAEKSMNREKGAHSVKSKIIKNMNTADSAPSLKTQAMADHEPVYIRPTFQANTQFKKEKSTINEFVKPSTMGTVLYLVAAIFLSAWVIGFFFYDMGAGIHTLLILALVAVLIRVVQGRSD